MKAIHPEPRESASPAGGKSVATNPPPLLWPAIKEEGVRYAVRLSQHPEFPGNATIGAEGFRWAMFNPHRKLSPGQWFWQYGATGAGGNTRWSEKFEFQIKKSARISESPSAAAMVAACPEAHPRLWVADGELGSLRKRLRGSAEAARFVRACEPYLGEMLPPDDAPPDQGESEYQVRTYQRWASKALAGKISGAIQWLAPGYLITGDERYAREAARRALHVAGWDPDGFTAPEVSDFADGSCVRVMAQAYDACYHTFSEEERALLRRAMATRANRFFETTANNLETRVFAAHIWQHLLLEFAEVAFATLHEIQDAEVWASYVYELWLARFPLMGGADGGWANGISYFGSNIETLLSVPPLFRRLAGIDLYANPWYRNAADFLLYVWPPKSAPDGFGDGSELRDRPAAPHVVFVEALAREYGNPYAAWYVQKCLESGDPEAGPMLAWRRMLSNGREARVRPKSPKDLPQAKAFRDVGIVSMHTDLAEAGRDLMVGFRSSPYGGYGHAHASQNSFNVLYGGERLFHNSGYYIAYGDEHFTGWYKHTRGHNTVLIDGKGQVFGSRRLAGSIVQHQTSGYGWVARFLNSRRIGYCLGDASNAYGDAGLVRFRRHLALLRPGTLVVYDDLEADHEAEWRWLLHSVLEMDAGAQRLRTETRTARAQADLIGPGPLGLTVDDRFDPPALNWRGKEIDGAVPEAFPNQWHAAVSPAAPCRAMRYLAIIQVRAAGDTAGFPDPGDGGDGWVWVSDWGIRAELDASNPAALEIRHRDGRTALGADVAGVTAGKTRYRAGRGKSILVEATGGPAAVQRSADELPEAAR